MLVVLYVNTIGWWFLKDLKQSYLAIANYQATLLEFVIYKLETVADLAAKNITFRLIR